jgi:hypothetical protein
MERTAEQQKIFALELIISPNREDHMDLSKIFALKLFITPNREDHMTTKQDLH